MTREEAIKRLKVWLICTEECPEDKQCYDSYLHSTCEYSDFCDDVSMNDAIRFAINSLEIDERYELEYEQIEPCEDAISRHAVDTLVDELARAISDERCCTPRGRSTATIMQDILDLPSVNPQPCEDAISRQAVLEIQAKYAEHIGATKFWQMRDDIKALQPVTPQPKTGHWIEEDGFDGDVYYDCSACGESFCLIDGTPTDNLYNYCPKCGAKMQEVSE